MVCHLSAGRGETGNEVEFDREIITKTCSFTNIYVTNRKKFSLKIPTVVMILTIKWPNFYLFDIEEVSFKRFKIFEVN